MGEVVYAAEKNKHGWQGYRVIDGKKEYPNHGCVRPKWSVYPSQAYNGDKDSAIEDAKSHEDSVSQWEYHDKNDKTAILDGEWVNHHVIDATKHQLIGFFKSVEMLEREREIAMRGQTICESRGTPQYRTINWSAT